jgi:hypothetical protein
MVAALRTPQFDIVAKVNAARIGRRHFGFSIGGRFGLWGLLSEPRPLADQRVICLRARIADIPPHWVTDFCRSPLIDMQVVEQLFVFGI